MPPLGLSRTRKKKQPFQVRIEGPDTAPIHAILEEIRIAIMRLLAQPTTQSIQQNLTDLQKEAYKLIRDEGPLLGKTIAPASGTTESAFTAHYVPALKRCGVKNKRGAGYYLDEPYV